MLFMGTSFATDIDAEGDGQPNANATADNLVSQNDEQAVTFPTLAIGQPATVTVAVTNNIGTTATLYGFIDWNGDGDGNDTGEAVTTTVPNGTVGDVTLTFNVPLNAATGVDLGARFRLSTSATLGPTDPAGHNGPIPAPNGEVEDYMVQATLGTATPTPTRTVTPTNTPDNTEPGGPESLSGVRGVVFNDLNSNGLQEPVETGMNAVLVQLFGPGPDDFLTTPDDVLVVQMLTITSAGVSGSYSFLGINPGLYRVRETVPSGYTATTPTNVPVSAPVAGVAIADFGNQQTGTINGVVYYDHNMNGVQDGSESGLGGVVVRLYAPGPDGVLGSADNVLLPTTTTVAGGGYSFSPVSPGSYLVRQTVPLGYVPTTPTDAPVVVPSGGAGQANFGDVQTGLVNGTVFCDWNGNTTQDTDEAGVPGVTVQLYSPGSDGFLGTVDHVLVGTTTTASNGTYSCIGMTPGSYLVRELTPSGFTTTTPSARPVVAPPNGAGVADFGPLQVGALSDVVFSVPRP